MKILLVLPHGPIHRAQTGTYKKALRYAPLTLTSLAALVPPELEAELVLIDEGVDTWNPDEVSDFDLVGISCMTGTSARAYALADRFREKGIPVILGGMHPTLCPQEAKQHADCVITGLAEQTWPQALRDFNNGALQGFYHMDSSYRFENIPSPRRDLLDRGKYVSINTVEATKGCAHACSFCAIATALNKRYWMRPVAEVIAEIASLKGKEVVFLDPNLVTNKRHARELFEALIPLRKIWVGCATIDLADDPQLLKLAAKSGCKGLLIGFESVNQETLRAVNKPQNAPSRYVEALKKFHAHGIAVQACFFFGSDTDDRDVFKRTVQFVYDANVDLPQYSVLTPFPGTTTFQELESQGRILHRDWSLYDAEHVVFQPKNLSPQELQEGLIYAWQESYSISSIAKRLAHSRCIIPVAVAANFGYRYYARKLDRYDHFRMLQEAELVVP